MNFEGWRHGMCCCFAICAYTHRRISVFEVITWCSFLGCGCLFVEIEGGVWGGVFYNTILQLQPHCNVFEIFSYWDA